MSITYFYLAYKIYILRDYMRKKARKSGLLSKQLIRTNQLRLLLIPTQSLQVVYQKYHKPRG